MRPTELRPATSTRSPGQRTAPPITLRSGANWRSSLTTLQEALRRSGERVLPFPERRNRDKEQSTLIRTEILEIVGNCEFVGARHSHRDCVRRESPREVFRANLADRQLLTPK